MHRSLLSLMIMVPQNKQRTKHSAKTDSFNFRQRHLLSGSKNIPFHILWISSTLPKIPSTYWVTWFSSTVLSLPFLLNQILRCTRKTGKKTSKMSASMPVNILCPMIWPPLCSSFSRDCVCQLVQVRNCGIFVLVTTGRFEQTLCRLSSRRKATVFFSCLLPLFEKNPLVLGSLR